MSAMALLLSLKIVVTALFSVVPMLCLPQARLAAMTGIEGGALFRLYGVALLALLTGYASAFPLVAAGTFPWGIAAMGMVSNGGAAAALVWTGGWRQAKAMTAFVALIALGLALAGLNSEAALRPLWPA